MKVTLLLILACSKLSAQSYSVFTFDSPAGLALQRVQAINNGGQILATYLDSSQALRSLLRSPDGSTYSPIEVPGASTTLATGLNNPGQLVGYYSDSSGTHSFLRAADGTYTKFDIPSDGQSGPQPPLPYALNDKGDIVGAAFSAGAVEWGFLLSADRATYTRIQVPKANWTEALSVHNNGDVVGTCEFGGSYGLKHAFLRTPDGTYTLIDFPGAFRGTFAVASNNRGQIVANGIVRNPDGATTSIDPTFAGPPTAIDDNGRLAGCVPALAICRGFLAVPSAGSAPVIRPVRGVISASGFGGFATISAGTWIEIYGSNLAGATRAWSASDFVGNTAPTALDNVSVTINGRRAIVSYISPGQVNALVPSGIAPGNAQVTVTNGGRTSLGYIATVTGVQPGILAVAQDITNEYSLGVFPDFQTYAVPPLVYPSLPPLPPLQSRLPKPGETIVLFGIGFGAGDLQGRVDIFFGFAKAQVTYAGIAPGSVGLYQFNVVVPEGVQGPAPLIIQLDGTRLQQSLYVALVQ